MTISRTFAVRLLSIGLLAAAAACTRAQTASLRVSNPNDFARPSEVVDLPLNEVQAQLHSKAVKITAHLHSSGRPLLTQPFASAIGGPTDRLLILIDLAPSEEVVLDLAIATANDKDFPSRVQARNVPERKDDFAWENDVVAFRTYGPALQATGEISSGIDIWSKRIPGFITTSWYQRDAESQRTHNSALSYHKDNGEGLDSYDVGPSRGCGGTAVLLDGKLVPSKNFTSSLILANGPIRADFVLEYAPWAASTVNIRETKRITLDAGSKLNHMRSTFFFDGSSETTIAAGVAMHADAALDRPTPAIVSVWDTPQLASAGHIGTALLSVHGAPQFIKLPMEGKLAGNALFTFNIHTGGSIDYYAGTAWSQADTPTQALFDSYLKTEETRLQQPVTTRWLASGSGKH